jgi:hypothetical protein
MRPPMKNTQTTEIQAFCRRFVPVVLTVVSIWVSSVFVMSSASHGSPETQDQDQPKSRMPHGRNDRPGSLMPGSLIVAGIFPHSSDLRLCIQALSGTEPKAMQARRHVEGFFDRR